jgi:putative ATPase
MRPATIEDIVGQEHLLGPGKPLSSAFTAKEPHSMILWGPPGVGKTTLARLMAHAFDCAFVAISAVFAGVKEIRAAVEQAQQTLDQSGQQTVLFVDEIHRFNKSQQDALLPFVESGLIVFVGATTENPGFEVNRALLSRAQVHVLKPIDASALDRLLQRAIERQSPSRSISQRAREFLVQQADGDARRLMNQLEIVLHAAAALSEPESAQEIDLPWTTQVLSASTRAFDKRGDAFYDQISALHKSVRGSDPDAALYWLTRMLDGGADPRFLCRRLIRMAWEDIGLADPRAIGLVHDAADAYDRLGSPEGDLALAQAAIYLAVAPKSNAGYKAYRLAKEFVSRDQSRAVPDHLRNAPTSLARSLGHGQGYRYDHDEPDGHAAGQQYFPDGMERPNWYVPLDRGLETQIREKIKRLSRLSEQNDESDHTRS